MRVLSTHVSIAIINLTVTNIILDITNLSTVYQSFLTYAVLVMVVINPLTAGAANIRVFIFYQHIKYHILNMLKIKCDINQQDLTRVDFHFVKSE